MEKGPAGEATRAGWPSGQRRRGEEGIGLEGAVDSMRYGVRYRINGTSMDGGGMDGGRLIAM